MVLWCLTKSSYALCMISHMHTYTFDDTHTHTFDDADILQKTKLRKRYQVGLEKLRSSAGQVCFVCLWLQFKAQLLRHL